MSARNVAVVSRNPVLQGFVALYSSRVFTQVANVMLGFWVAGVLGPQNFGFWKAIDLIQQYHPFTALGVQNAMTLEVPYALGQGRAELASKISRVALGSVFLLPLLTSMGVLFWGLARGGDPLYAYAFAVMGFSTFLTILYNYGYRLMFAYQDFVLASKVLTVYTVSTVVFTAVLVYYGGIYGRILAVPVAVLPPLVMLLRYTHLEKRPEFDPRTLAHLVKLGLPLMIVNMIFILLTTVDRMVILKFLTVTALGYYGLALMITQIIGGVGEVVGEQIFPKLNMKFGRTGEASALFDLATAPAIALSPVFAFMLCATGLLLEPVIRSVLPKYVEGVAAAQILVYGTVIYWMSCNVLLTIRRLYLYIVIEAVALVVTALLLYIVATNGGGLSGIALATSLGFSLNSLALTLISFVLMGKTPTHFVKFVGKTLLPVVSVSLLLLLVNWAKQAHVFGDSRSLSYWSYMTLILGLTAVPLAVVFRNRANALFAAVGD